ncbi:MAG: RNA 2'-phosphotransferase [Planctomycetota bacterium]|nr:RNA 2'-phosphotransferase [Planctomycetota bacterium]
MIDTNQIERVTRLLAYMLRHQPGDFDLELDNFGYAEIDDVLRALAERTGEDFDEDDLAQAIESGDRPRYEIVDGKIRALYGHSIEIDPGETAEPPEDLFVALPARDRERMERYGLRGGRRRFLHLALTLDEARESGRRAAIEYVVIKVSAVDAWEQGVDFYDRKSIWLAPELPTYSLEVVGEYDDGTDPAERRRAREGSRGPRREERGGRGRERGGRGRGRDEERGGRGGRGGRGRDEERSAPREEPRREPRPAPEPRDEAPAPAPAPERKAPAPRSAPAPEPSDSGFGFGAGVTEAQRQEAARVAATEAAAKPAPRSEPKPEPKPQDGAGGFGAGL